MHRAIYLYEEGNPVSKIAKILGLTEGRIYQIFRESGYKLDTLKSNKNKGKKKNWSDEEIKYLKENLHVPATTLAKNLDRTYTAVMSKLSKLGLHVKHFCRVCGKRISQKGTYCTEHNWIERRVAQIKYRSRQKKWTFNLDDEQIIEMVQQECFYCGLTGGGVDRIDSEKGYVSDNVVPCCFECNAMKLDMKLDEWLKLMKRIISHIEQKEVR